MKAKFLKIAGVKNEKEFYKKYPTEEEFFAKCGKKIKKAFPGMNFLGGGADAAAQATDAAGQATEMGFGQKLFEGFTGGNPIGMAMNIFEGAKAQKEKVNQAKQNMLVMTNMRDAYKSNKRDEQRNLQESRIKSYVRPEDYEMTGEELFPIYGVGSNVLAKHGKKMKGYQDGGKFLGMGGEQWKNIGMQGLNSVLPRITQNSGIMSNDLGSQIGGKFGSTLGSLTGIPGMDKVGQLVFGGIGNAIDRSDTKIKRYNKQSQDALDDITGMNFAQKWQNQFSANAEYGKNMKYAEGGDIKMVGDGELEPISSNPYGSDTYMIKGDPHSKGGEDMVVNGTPIEAEGQEPITAQANGDVDIQGNLDIPSHIKGSLEKFTDVKMGKKFKTATKNIAEAENKANMSIDNNVKKAENYTPLRPLDRISLNTLDTNIKIEDEKLKKYQIAKDGLSKIQEGLNGDEGVARYGRKFKKKAQWGGGAAKAYTPVSRDESGMYGGVTQEQFESLKTKNPWFDFEGFDASKPEDVKRLQQEYNKRTGGRKVKVDGKLGPQTASLFLTRPVSEIGPAELANPLEMNVDIPNYFIPKEGEEKKKDPKKPWLDLSGLGQLWRGTNAEPFDISQLTPEVWAMANNKLEPVQAQKYQPRLRTPYDISLQDQRNAVTSTSRAMQRMIANRPELAGELQAQTQEGLNKVNAEEFRQNQAFKDKIYSGNLEILNDADLKNLAIADQQYVRQEQAKSNTKATDLEAIKSMTDKRLKHRLENQTLRVWENMYDYRYDKAGRAWYAGPPADFSNWETVPPGQYQDTDRYEYYRGPDGKTYRRERSGTANYAPNMGAARAAQRATGQPSLSTNPYVGKNGYIVKKLKTYK